MGLPPGKLIQMLGNVAADSIVGSIPVAGDVFDLFFKSHRRNLEIILEHFGVDRDELRRN